MDPLGGLGRTRSKRHVRNLLAELAPSWSQLRDIHASRFAFSAESGVFGDSEADVISLHVRLHAVLGLSLLEAAKSLFFKSKRENTAADSCE